MRLTFNAPSLFKRDNGIKNGTVALRYFNYLLCVKDCGIRISV